MKLPISWLKEYVSTTASVEEISAALVNIGFEVEDVIYYGRISGVVVGRITDMKPHPDADKLKICAVDVGSETLAIVTGADNVSVGDLVPVAKDGAVLPSGKVIKSAPLRGVMSYGMMCSGGELDIPEAFVDGASVNGILLLRDVRPGEDIVSALDLADAVLDVSITANRPDCQSVLGLSRELAAALKAKFSLPSTEFHSADRMSEMPKVTVECKECPAYTGAVITDIRIEKSPKWMQRRLFMCGINPIDNVVDITNYVLLEVGQPLHAFDMDMIEGGMHVRYAAKDEKITALNGEEYALGPNIMLIADDKRALAIAGVMGGKFSGISAETKKVFLESARFFRGSIRNASLKLGLRSDSSARFERGVDYFGVEFGRKRALALLEQLGAGKVVCEKGIEPRERSVITTTIDQINGILGVEVPKKFMVDNLGSLGMEVETDCRNLTVTIPPYREDIDNFTDLAEEVIRFYGYDKMNETFMPTSSVTIGGMTHRQSRIEKVKDLMCGFGAYEIMTYSFTDERVFDKLNLVSDDARRNAIRIRNPISEDLSVMKTELVSGMISVIATNITRKNDNFRLFELAKTYTARSTPLTELPIENDVLCVGTCGAKEDLFALKGIFTAILDYFGVKYDIRPSEEPYLHPGMRADIVSGDKIIGSLGKLHPLTAKNWNVKRSDIYVGSLDLAAITTSDDVVARYKPLPKFPPVERDLAFVVAEEVPVGDIIKAIGSCDCLIGGVDIFDIYRGEQIEKGCKSVALKINLTPSEKTLVDAEIAEVMAKVVAVISGRFGGKVRA